MESKQHWEEVLKVVEKLKSEGWRVINLDNKSPDAIAIKDGKVVAVEVLGFIRKHKKGRGNPKKNCYSLKDKKLTYSMFDDLIIEKFEYEKSRKKREYAPNLFPPPK